MGYSSTQALSRGKVERIKGYAAHPSRLGHGEFSCLWRSVETSKFESLYMTDVYRVKGMRKGGLDMARSTDR